MRQSKKVDNLDKHFPLLEVKGNALVSTDGDITLAYKVQLPELFTITKEEYDIIHGVWSKAIGILPNYSIVHKQDWFVSMKYDEKIESNEESTFLNHASKCHFNERPFLEHFCYLFLTKSVKKRMVQQSSFSSLCRGKLVPKEALSEELIKRFYEATSQFERIINESGFLKMSPISEDEIVGTKEKPGLLDQYLSLSKEKFCSLEDIRLEPDLTRIGDKQLCVHTLSTPEDLPMQVSPSVRNESYSTDRSSCHISFASSFGLFLSCNHIYNQYIFIEDGEENLKKFEAQSRNMQSLGRFSRANQINDEWIQMYLNTAHSLGWKSVSAHFNIQAWTEDKEQYGNIRNNVGASIAQAGCKPNHNTIDAATLYWSAMPGNEADFPAEERFYTFVDPAICFFNNETNYRDSLSPFGIKMIDRLYGKPIHLDISDLPMNKGVITNRNKFILGPSGSGKSFFTNHMVRQYYEQGAHVLLVDTGNSYLGLCELIHSRTKGEDGIYYTYKDEDPISFNPFYTDDYVFDIEKRESISTLILTLWKNANEPATKTEMAILGTAVSSYIKRITEDRSIRPCFNTFYEFIKEDYRKTLETGEIKASRSDFDIDNFLLTLLQYYKGGRYDFLLNSDKNIDLLNKRFIVFEIDAIKDNKDLFPVVTIIIMESFINKMRRLQGIRKMILIEEAWKAIASANMADYIKYLYKTVRKFFGEAIVVTQEVDDIIQSPVVKESIINNSDCKILLDQRKYMNKFDNIQSLLGLSDKERGQILSINLNNSPSRRYKEVWIGLGGTQSNVYATEVSMEEYLAYTTEETEKIEVLRRAETLGGNMEMAIRQMANEKRTKRD